MTLIRLLGSVAVAAVAAPGLAQGQEPVDATAGAFSDEILVTARKREESLQDVPVAITAFTADEIKSARVESLADVAKLTPGLNFTPLFGAQNQLPIIRGAAQTFGQLNVGVFLDGVYLSGKAAVDLELNDLERIEVVRGPQSALYGRNTFAGAINYVTRRPAAEPEARAEVTVGDRGLIKVSGAASGPLGDTLRVRVGGFYRNHNGWYRSSIDGGRVDFSETWGGILTLEWQPADNVLVTWRGSYSDERSGQPPSSVIRTNAAPALTPPPRNLLFIGQVPSIPRDGVTVNTGSGVLVGPGGETASYGQNQTTYRTNLKVEIDGGPVIVTSLTSFDRRETDYVFDGDNTICDLQPFCPAFGPPIPFGFSTFGTSSNDGTTTDWAQELRFASPGGGSFDWLVGAFYYDNKTRGIDRSLNPLTPANANAFGYPEQTLTTQSLAVFGSLTWRPGGGVGLTGELRYENEKQRFTQRPTNGVPSLTDPSRRVFNLSRNFEFVTPRVILDWRANDEVLLYASVARGAKTGGFNTNLAILDTQRTYGPEKSWNYEIGAKTDLFDRRLRFNLAGYYMDWEDQQVACQNPLSLIPGTTTQRTYVCNVGQARIWGIEADFVARLADVFAITGSYTYTNARYRQFVDDSLTANLIQAGLPPIDFDGKRLPYVPEHKFVLSPRLNVPLGGGWDGEARVDLVHQTRTFVRADNLQSFAPKTTVDLRLGAGNDRFQFQAFVDNLFDDDTPVAGVRFFDSARFFTSSPLVQGPPRRQIGGTVRVAF